MAMDILYLATAVAFFALSVALVFGCERLRRPS
jgi:hypothetical protein